MMVDGQVRVNDVTEYALIDAMLKIPRELFVPEARREAAYLGENLDIGGGRMMLEPRTQAKMLAALDIAPGETVLDIGCGRGYSAALIAHVAEAVVAVEDSEEMVSEAEGALAEAEIDNVAVLCRALAEGAPRHGPYDVICIEGGVERVPEAIAGQLREGGRIAAIFMEGRLGVVRVGYRSGGAVSWREAFNASAPVLPGFEAERAFSL